MSSQEGRVLGHYLGEISDALIAHGPTRIIETVLGRLEIATEIPPPGGSSPEGPHTHLLPVHLSENRDVPPDVELPAGHLIGAIYYPHAPAH